MSGLENKITAMKDLWNELSAENSLKYVSHLQKGAEWDVSEFHLTGVRFVSRIMERYRDYGVFESNLSSVVEIGCGVGRFTKVLAARFKYVYGLDISDKMLADAVHYCGCMPNITFINNDGSRLETIEDESVEYACTAGVFQHITHIGAIVSYIKEALRVLKPGGLFLFQFEANHIDAEGERGTGARIHADLLNEELAGLSYEICEMSLDPLDPTRNMVIVLRKTDAPGDNVSFTDFPVTERRWISGVYDDIRTKSAMHENLKREFAPLTFFSLPE